MKNNSELESYIIGCMGLRQALYLEGIQNLKPEYFSLADYRKIFSYMQEMKADPFDLSGFMLFLTEKQENKKIINVLMKAMDMPGSTSYFTQAMKQLITQKAIQEKHDAVREFQSRIDKGESAESDLFKKLDEISNKYRYQVLEDFNLDQVIQKTGQEEGIGLGLEGITSISNRPGTVTVVAARTSEGKTTFMLNSMMNLFVENKKNTFIFYTYEEETKYIFVKIFIIYLGWRYPDHAFFQDQNSFKSALIYLVGENKENDPQAFGILQEMKKAIAEKRIMLIAKKYNEEQLKKSINNWVAQYPVGCVFIDYIQKIPSEKKGTRFEEMQRVSAGILDTAIQANVPIVIGAQLNREATKGNPTLGMIRECGDIEQDANSVIALQKEEGERDTITATILKAREGVRNGSRAVRFLFDGRKLFLKKEVQT